MVILDLLLFIIHIHEVFVEAELKINRFKALLCPIFPIPLLLRISSFEDAVIHCYEIKLPAV